MKAFLKYVVFRKFEGKGVLIPEANKDEIILKSEVEEAIINGKFYVYTMNSLMMQLKHYY